MLPSPRFICGVQANLRYWLGQTAVLDDAAISRLNPEFPNVLQAVEMGLVLAETRRDTAVLILQCFFWVEAAGRVHQWRPLVEKCLAVMPVADDRLRFRLLKQAGQFQRLQRDWDTAVTTFQAAQKLARRLNDNQAIAEIQLNLAQVHRFKQEYDQARQQGKAALALLAKMDNSVRLQLIALQLLGQLAQERGNLPRAEHYFRQAVRLGHETQITADITRTMNDLARVLHAQMRYQAALETYQEIWALLAHTSREKEKVELLINRGSLFFDWDKLEEASASFSEAEQCLAALPDSLFYEALLANNVGCVWQRRRQFATAEPYFRRSIAVWRQYGDELQLANALDGLGDVLFNMGRTAESRACFDEAYTLAGKYPANNWANQLRAMYAEKANRFAQNTDEPADELPAGS